MRKALLLLLCACMGVQFIYAQKGPKLSLDPAKYLINGRICYSNPGENMDCPWLAPATMQELWGYHAKDFQWKSGRQNAGLSTGGIKADVLAIQRDGWNANIHQQ